MSNFKEHKHETKSPEFYTWTNPHIKNINKWKHEMIEFTHLFTLCVSRLWSDQWRAAIHLLTTVRPRSPLRRTRGLPFLLGNTHIYTLGSFCCFHTRDVIMSDSAATLDVTSDSTQVKIRYALAWTCASVFRVSFSFLNEFAGEIIQ